jgi:hypothetical protein
MGSVKKAAPSTGYSLCDLLDTQADDGQGNDEGTEGDASEESDYVEEEDEGLVNESTLLLPPKCHLHPTP